MVTADQGLFRDPLRSAGATDGESFGPNTVGSAQSKFDHRVERSNLYTNTYANATDQVVRDVAEGQNHLPESQIYNWGIKKDTPLDGVQPVVSDSSHGVSSGVPGNSIANDS